MELWRKRPFLLFVPFLLSKMQKNGKTGTVYKKDLKLRNYLAYVMKSHLRSWDFMRDSWWK